jgi:hypothetical protein
MENNFSTVGNQQTEATAAFVEKIINGIDANLMAQCFSENINPESGEAVQGKFNSGGTGVRLAASKLASSPSLTLKKRCTANCIEQKLRIHISPPSLSSHVLLSAAARGAHFSQAHLQSENVFERRKSLRARLTIRDNRPRGDANVVPQRVYL